MAAEVGEMPRFVSALPAAFRRQIKAQCGGDWRRVTQDSRGGIIVHNQPQRDLDHVDESRLLTRRMTRPPAEAASEPEPERVRPPARPLRTIPRPPRTSALDTTTFRRVDLPAAVPLTVIRDWAQENNYPVAPRGRIPVAIMEAYRVAHHLSDGILTPPPAPPPAPPAAPRTEVPARPAPTPRPPRASPARPGPARPGPALFKSGPKVETVRPQAAPGIAPRLSPQPRDPRPVSNRRSGVPRTSLEMLKRFLDLGCKYTRVPEQPFAQIFYGGHLVAMVRCEDALDRRVVASQYEAVRTDLITRGAISAEA